MTFSNLELDALKILWKEDRPLTRSEFVKYSPNQTLKPNSVAYILKKLQEKGAVELSGVKKETHHFSGQYIAAITQEEYVADYLISEVPGLDYSRLLSILIKRGQIDRKALAEVNPINT